MKKLTNRRQPRQQRSKKRVDAILQAAKSLIAEKGSAQLKIHDIARRAEVTPASIYQYFPSKNAITHALAESTFNRMHEHMLDELPAVHTREEAFQTLQGLVEKYYQLYLDDPALYDVWVCISADKSVHDMDIQDSRRTSELIYECLRPFYPEQAWVQLVQVGFLLAHLSGAAVRMAVSIGEEEGRLMVDSFKSMISPAFIESLLSSGSAGESV